MASLSQVGPVTKRSGEMPFIVSYADGKVDPSTRKLIRSHAMRGRKQERIHAKKNVLVNSADLVAGFVETAPFELDDITRMYTPPDRRIGSDLSFVALPSDMRPSMLLNITKGPQ